MLEEFKSQSHLIHLVRDEGQRGQEILNLILNKQWGGQFHSMVTDCTLNLG